MRVGFLTAMNVIALSARFEMKKYIVYEVEIPIGAVEQLQYEQDTLAGGKSIAEIITAELENIFGEDTKGHISVYGGGAIS